MPRQRISEPSESSVYEVSSSCDSETEAVNLDLDQLSSTDIRQTIVEDINDKYALAKFAGHSIPMCKETGRLNLATICKIGGKRLKNYNETKHAKALIAAVKTKLRQESGVGIQAPFSEPECAGPRQVRGTYGHSLIAIDVAAWCSPEFGIEVYTIALESFARDALDDREAEYARILGKKNDAYAKLARKMDRAERKAELRAKEARQEAKKAKKEADRRAKEAKEEADRREAKAIKRAKKESAKQEATHRMYYENLLAEHKITHKHLGVSNSQRVPPLTPEAEHHMMIYRTNYDPEDYDSDDDEEPGYDYVAIRAQGKSVKNSIRAVLASYPDAEPLVHYQDVPNAMRLWNAYKKEHSRRMRRTNKSRTAFDLKRGYSERRMLADLREMYDRRFDNDSFGDDSEDSSDSE